MSGSQLKTSPVSWAIWFSESSAGLSRDSTRAPVDPAAAVTRSLLGYGVLAGVFDLMAGLAQARTRNGNNLTRHDQSLLANGPQRLDPERQLQPDGGCW